jgi:RNA polymerase sigma-70 factor (ECF subfamily)
LHHFGQVKFCEILLESSILRKKRAQAWAFLLACAQFVELTIDSVTGAPLAPNGSPFKGRISAKRPNAPHRMATDKELSDFLETVERRAFKQAVYAVRKDESALDIVQDAMIKLAEKYGDKPAAELPLLFQRILQNTIHDYFRREKVRNTWVSLFSSLGGSAEGHEDFDLLETYEAEEGSQASESSEDKVGRDQILAAIDEEVQKLPARQREAFLMRYWQDMDVAETAAAMGCSEGSVKTHCSRATHALAHALRAKGITL